jgi:predicted DNA repair protein MutK
MATSLLALIDDIASVLDDVAVLTKVAAKKTAGVLGDDLALNAEQVSGVRAQRELPVVWAVFKGSLRNKLILVPLALAISLVAPWAVTPLLMVGGGYLCFEGVEKLAHAWLHRQGGAAHAQEDAAAQALHQALLDPSVDFVALEADKIRGAIRTDFVLSAEIIAITLGTVQNSSLWTQFSVLSGISILMTVGVYGLVAGIVRMDDVGLYLSRLPKDRRFAGLLHSLGRGLLLFAPVLMKMLSVLGTVAMFLVGGGIVVHGLPALEHVLVAAWPVLDNQVAKVVLDLLLGLVTGAVLMLGVHFVHLLRRKVVPA